MNKYVSGAAIRLTRSAEVARALAIAKKRYPTLSDPEILKLGLAKLTTGNTENDSPEAVRRLAAYSFNVDGYLDDPAEDIYRLGMGKKTEY
jgi:hypothetical protein